MTSLIDPTTTESFYTALENAQEDYQDFKETYESAGLLQRRADQGIP